MAARRLIFVMVVLLMLSSFAAALVPVSRDDEEGSSSTTTAAPKTVAAGGQLVEKRIDASAKESKTIQIELGDHLALEVAANKPGQVEIAGLGEFDDVEPGTPAHFDLLPFRDGRYEVRLVEADRLLGTIIVTSPAPKKQKRAPKGEQQGGSGERPTRV